MLKKDYCTVTFAKILLIFIGIFFLISGCVEDIKEKSSNTESITETTKVPNTWVFKDKLTSNDDTDTYKIDLKDKTLGGLLKIDFAAPSSLGSHPYKLKLTDSNEMPFQEMSSSGRKESRNAVVEGGEVYHVVVSTWGDKHDPKNDYIVNIKFLPHSSNNSPSTAIPISIPDKVDGSLVSEKDVIWYKVGPVNSSGLLVIESSGDKLSDGFKIVLLDDKTNVVQEYMKRSIRYHVEKGKTYYITSMSPYLKDNEPVSFSLITDLIPISVNSDPENAIPIKMLETIEGIIVSTKDTNWYKLDLSQYYDGDIVINFAVPDQLFNKGGNSVSGGPYKLEIFENDKINIIGFVYALSQRPGIFQKEMIKGTVGRYPQNGIEGGKIYYIKVSSASSDSYNPTESYKFNIEPVTMVSTSVMDEKPNMYTSTSNTADTAMNVKLPAKIQGWITNENDNQWLKADIGSYPKGGVLIVSLTMPTKTGPSCEFVCNQPVCFNPPQTPPDCYNYQFAMFEEDKKTKVTDGSVTPNNNKIFRNVLKNGGQYFFNISAPHGRYNKDEPYTFEVRFSPN